jgi:hypothetical protein
MTVANLGRQHHRSLASYFKSSWECLYLFGVVSYYFIPPILFKLFVYIFKAHITYVFIFPQYYANFTPFVILMREWHLNNTTPFVFPKRVILKRENNTLNMVFNDAMVDFYMMLLMNRFTNNVINDGRLHPLPKTLPSLDNNLWWNIVTDDWGLDEKSTW